MTKDWWERNKDKVNKARRSPAKRAAKRLLDVAYKQRHPERIVGYNRRYNDKHPERALLGSAKARAKKYAVPFALTPADIIIPKRCPALGIALQRRLGASADNSPTLDRIIPSLGYVRGNVEIISSLANRIKTNASVEQIALVLKWLRRQQKGTNNG